MNGATIGWATLSTVACPSSMHSRRLAWVFGEDRLISSARTTLAKIGPGRNSKPGGLLVEDADARHVAGEEVGRELDAGEPSTDGAGEGLGEQRLADSGVVLDDDVAAGQQGDDARLDDLLLAEDDRRDVARRRGSRAGRSPGLPPGLPRLRGPDCCERLSARCHPRFVDSSATDTLAVRRLGQEGSHLVIPWPRQPVDAGHVGTASERGHRSPESGTNDMTPSTFPARCRQTSLRQTARSAQIGGAVHQHGDGGLAGRRFAGDRWWAQWIRTTDLCAARISTPAASPGRSPASRPGRS